MGTWGLEAGEWVGRKGFWEEGSSKLSFKGSEEVSTVRAGGDGVSSRGLEECGVVRLCRDSAAAQSVPGRRGQDCMVMRGRRGQSLQSGELRWRHLVEVAEEKDLGTSAGPGGP